MSTSAVPSLTTTSFAMLGLLAIRPYTTYELAQQMDRTLSRFWPRARSKLYEEPKKLVAHGLAKTTRRQRGRRSATEYRITAAGRRALAAWVAAPGAGPVLEWEQLLKVFYAENGSTDDLLRTLHDVRAWVDERTVVNIAVGRSYLEGHGPFPERAPILALTGRFLDDLLEALDNWAAWATDVAETWPPRPSEATPPWAAVEEVVERGVARTRRWRADASRHARR